MKWAFWRKDDAAASAGGGRRAAVRAVPADADDDPGRADPAQALRVRARRRLIGAAALLLAAVIIVPMVLDPASRPVPDTVPIDIPSEKTPFTPRLPLPPVPDPGQLQGGPPPDANVEPKPAESAAKADKAAADSKASIDKPGSDKEAADKAAADKAAAAKLAAEKAAADKAAAAKAADAQRARELLEGKAAKADRSAEKPADKSGKADGRYAVQAAAPRNEQAAKDLAARLKKAGLNSYIEKVQASDGARFRVRVGPFATRNEAEQARTRLKELGVGADLIAP